MAWQLIEFEVDERLSEAVTLALIDGGAADVLVKKDGLLCVCWHCADEEHAIAATRDALDILLHTRVLDELPEFSIVSKRINTLRLRRVLDRVLLYGLGIIGTFFVLLFLLTVQFNHDDHRGMRKAFESTLKGNLYEIRNAITVFYDDTGVYPSKLTDLVEESDDPARRMPATYRGPYLATQGGVGNSGIPCNPFVDDNDKKIDDHWHYDSKTGKVWSAAEGVTLDGIKYSEL